ncbi:hypothetical protein GYMLUDRAFT_777404 [Collybiopsis luxurians FD-317 M1]|uniref:Uncharacterized protein n=1 Tax=Collybiopsis luxurians FD-317 M1 TaxID=944289 RepID=A0A0D0BPG2_9AGAR|nr:hypothetical protein GYMLUDRAFT_777404 [Collybiopsis luxurians FD-317 M1]
MNRRCSLTVTMERDYKTVPGGGLGRRRECSVTTCSVRVEICTNGKKGMRRTMTSRYSPTYLPTPALQTIKTFMSSPAARADSKLIPFHRFLSSKSRHEHRRQDQQQSRVTPYKFMSSTGKGGFWECRYHSVNCYLISSQKLRPRHDLHSPFRQWNCD